MGMYLFCLLVALLFCFTTGDSAASVTISNGATAVVVEIDSSNYLTETYFKINSDNSKTQVLTYNGPLITGAIFDGVYVSWTSAKQVSPSSVEVTGSILYLQDSNFQGGDYIYYNLTDPEPSVCLGMCLNDTKCRAWTYVKPGYQGQLAQCYLKNGTPNPAPGACCESGYTVFPTLTRTISLTLNTKSNTMQEVLGVAYVEHTFSTPFPLSLNSIDDWYTFAALSVDFAYSPNIKHQNIDLTPHWEFKSPVVMLQTDNLFAAMVPDVDTITKESVQAFPPNLDLRNDGITEPAFSFAITSSVLTFHSLYSRDDGTLMNWTTSSPAAANYYLFLSSTAQPLQGYLQITPLLWDMFGHDRLIASPDMQTGYFNTSLQRFDQWREDTWYRFAQQVYLQFPCGSRMCGSMASYLQEGNSGYGTNQDGWFNSWFQTLRTAYGMYLAATKLEDTNLARQAVQVLNLALNAPQYKTNWGPFASIFWLGTDNSINWVLDAGGSGVCRVLPNPPADCIEYYHTFDNSWTGYWLLQWAKVVNDSRIMPMLTGYADFLLSVQQEDGGIPSWFEQETLRPAQQFLILNSEVAGSAVFLSELYLATMDKSYLAAALKAEQYLYNNIIPQRRWFDFETYFSCSLKPLGFYDGFTSQNPENNLGKFQTVILYYNLYIITQNTTYLDIGQNVLDYTLLTQQVWSHVLLTPNLLGGFTTQNTDNEWSDARQGYAADFLLKYYRETWRLEYLERGIAALRSSFAVAPYENWAHTGGSQGDIHGALTGIHWCQGSGMTSIEMHSYWLQDAYVNAHYYHAVGVNGCTIMDLQVTNSTISFALTSEYTWPNGLVVSIEGVTATTQVSVNGQSLGSFSPAAFVNVVVPQSVISG